MKNLEEVTKMIEDQADRGAKINHMAKLLRLKWILAEIEQTQVDLMQLLNQTCQAHYA